MPNVTKNYGLKKPLPEEFYDVSVQNDNMDIIDAELKKRATLNENGKVPEEQLPDTTFIPVTSEIPSDSDIWIDPDDVPVEESHILDKNNPHGVTAEQIGAAPAGYPNASMGEQWGNYGGADAGKFDYWAYLYVTEYTGGVVDVYLQGKFTVEPNSTFNYGIDTTAVLAKINEMTGKNYTTWETQRTLSASIIDAKTGVTTSSLIGYLLCFLRRTNASKLYLAISRVHNSSGNAGSWSLQQIYDTISDGSAYMNLHLRAKLS